MSRVSRIYEIPEQVLNTSDILEYVQQLREDFFADLVHKVEDWQTFTSGPVILRIVETNLPIDGVQLDMWPKVSLAISAEITPVITNDRILDGDSVIPKDSSLCKFVGGMMDGQLRIVENYLSTVSTIKDEPLSMAVGANKYSIHEYERVNGRNLFAFIGTIGK